MALLRRSTLLLLVALAAPAAAQAPATERITLVVEVTERDHTPVIACGIMGAQPRAVVAHVLSVEEGHYDGETIHLRWPVCEFSHVEPGDRFRIRIRRRTGAPANAATSYLVRSSDPVRP